MTDAPDEKDTNAPRKPPRREFLYLATGAMAAADGAAAENLHIPSYRFVDENTVEIGGRHWKDPVS